MMWQTVPGRRVEKLMETRMLYNKRRTKVRRAHIDRRLECAKVERHGVQLILDG